MIIICIVKLSVIIFNYIILSYDIYPSYLIKKYLIYINVYAYIINKQA